MKKKIVAFLVTTAITALARTGCGQTGSIAVTGSDTESTGAVSYTHLEKQDRLLTISMYL